MEGVIDFRSGYGDGSGFGFGDASGCGFGNKVDMNF